MAEQRIVYRRSHDVERGRPDRGRPYFRWFPGWSRIVDGHETFPCVTYREAQAEARKEGAVAVFERQ